MARLRGSRARKIPDRLDISKVSSTRQTGFREHSAADQHSIAAGRGQLLQDDPRLQSNRTKLAVEKARGDVQVSGSSSDEGSSSDDDLDFVGRILD